MKERETALLILPETVDLYSEQEIPDSLTNFKPPSWFTPNLKEFPCIHLFVQMCTNELESQISPQPQTSNLKAEERQALQELRLATEVVIKSSDKGGNIVLMQRDQYVNMCMQHLTDEMAYQILKDEPTKKFLMELQLLAQRALTDNTITQNEYRFIVSQSNITIATFYCLPKIHKDPHNPPGRPIVSGNHCLTERASQFLDKLLQPLVTELRSHIRDTKQTLLALENLTVPPYTSMITPSAAGSIYCAGEKRAALPVVTGEEHHRYTEQMALGRRDVLIPGYNKYLVARSIFSEPAFKEVNKKEEHDQRYFRKRVKENLSCTSRKALLAVKSLFPVLDWLPKYKWKELLIHDTISGISTGFVGTLQGLAYALLSSVPVVFGLYSAFFPILTYFFLGTSRHIAVGPFPIISLMVGTVVVNMAPDEKFIIANSTELNGTVIDTDARDAARVLVAGTLSFLIGIIQLVLGALQFGFIVRYLADPLVRGFTTAAAFHVVVSQIKFLFNVPTKSHVGVFSIIYTLNEVCSNISKTNFADLTAGLIALAICLTVKELNERCKHILRIPVPIELIVAIVATGISYGANLEETYNANIVKNIPSGFTAPMAPDWNMFPQILGSAFSIGIVAYAIVVSVGKAYATKYNYEIDGNQELIAFGITNLFSGAFSCTCATTALSRSAVQESTGGKTQVAGMISAAVVMIAMLSVGRFFEPLQKSVLAAIVIANVKGMCWQVQDVPGLWRKNKWDCIIWIFSCTASFFLDIDLGLLISLVFSLFTVLLRVQFPSCSTLGNVPGTDLYKDPQKYKNAIEPGEIKIIRFSSCIFYGNVDSLKNGIKSIVGFDAVRVFNKRNKAERKIRKLMNQRQLTATMNGVAADTAIDSDEDNYEPHKALNVQEVTIKQVHTSEVKIQIDWNSDLPVNVSVPKVDIHSIIFDFGQITFVDIVAVEALKMIYKQFHRIDVDVYIAGCDDNVYEKLEDCAFFDDIIKPDICFLTIHDAVLHIEDQRGLSTGHNLLDVE
ncbi:solute carrier family 26, member 4 [Pelobates cultripes]|uniref:Solute carrier family 26, member 4 n=2 Tax=Pelobates cultripes TaxID=61616 RepID=A0AAD1RSD6_PELCU|nr:solute carrier family 26, member 4 [Pelobates cultripes]